MVAVLAMLASCNGSKFHVDGKIEGASDTVKMVLESSSNGMWFIVDSVNPGTDGSFSLAEEAPEYPNIYRLRIGDQSIYFPIDSIDHITVNSKFKTFATDYTLAGSDHAVQVMNIDKKAMKFSNGQVNDAELQAWKKELAGELIKDPAGIVAYYIINKNVGNRPLFDPLDDGDLRIIGAVANAFNTFRPDDPRTSYLVNVLMQGQQRRRANSAPADTMYATMASIIDINLDDYDGKKYSLVDVASKHGTVLLNFTMYKTEFSPMFNKLLNDIYTAHKGAGFEIYQISLDNDNVAWLQAARNLPWITVYDPNGQNSTNVGNYQVRGVPTSFIIKNGEIVERVDDANKLKATVDKYM